MGAQTIILPITYTTYIIALATCTFWNPSGGTMSVCIVSTNNSSIEFQTRWDRLAQSQGLTWFTIGY